MATPYRPRAREFLIYVVPGTVVFAFCTILPIAFTIGTGFFKWQGGSSLTYIGLENWGKLLSDTHFWNAFGRNLVLVVISVAGQVGIGFLLAMLFSSERIRGAEVYRAALFVPVVLASVVVGFLWMIMYNRQFGLINAALIGLGLQSWIQDWLGNPRLVLYSIGIAKIWQYVGLHLMIILAGIQSISTDVLDSARIDGAGPIRRAISIVLPLIRTTIVVSVMISIAANMKEFDHVFTMTGGGPGRSSTVLALYAYKQSIERLNLGYGGVVAIGILILSMVLVLTVRRLILFKQEDA
jgi:raffinose/stachyose/melibiose transport system permease protein